MSLRQLTDWLVYLAVRLVICFIQTLRIETCQSLARLLAFLACDILRLRQKVLEENLQHVYPDWTPAERKRLMRHMWEHLALLVCELAHVHRKIHETNWRQHITLRGKEDIVRRLLDPRPAVFVSGHFGNFEVAGYVAGLLGFASFAIARPLDNPHLNRFINEFRQSRGQYILPKQGSAVAIDAVLRSGGVLALLGDQYAGPKGCWVDFLGRPASCHKALAIFALTGDAPLLVTYAKRLEAPLKFEVGLEDLADPRTLPAELAAVKPLTQWYNRALERVILSAPEQYWWLHRRWKGTPRGRVQKKPRTEITPKAA